jgi:predicted ABC-class ATPase
MSALNDAVGDGRYIAIPERNLMYVKSEEELLQMSHQELVEQQEQLDEQASAKCAVQLCR